MVALKKHLPPENIALSLMAEAKEGIIEELLNLMIQCHPTINKSVALKDLLEREAKMSTGIEQGVAIPHCKTTAVEELYAVLTVSKEGRDFQSLDGQPSHIFVMMLSPKKKIGPHIEFLATISQALKKKTTREKIILAPTPSEVCSLIYDF